MAARTDRDKIRSDYIVRGMSVTEVCRVHNVGRTTVRRWMMEEGWTKERERLRAKAKEEANKRLGYEMAQEIEAMANMTVRCRSTAERMIDNVNAMLDLGRDALAPRDLLALSNVVLNCMSVHSSCKQEDEADSKSEEWTVNIVNQDWGDEDAKH